MSLTFKLTEDIPEPSTSVEELNNELTKMRKIVKTAKLFVRRDLNHYIKKLRDKSVNQPQNVKLKQKLQHRMDDIKLLGDLTVTRLCKRLLAAERTEELAEMGHTLSPEDRLIARLRSTKPVNTFITTFRKHHEDWRSLVHYLLYKNVSGKWKSREQKRRGRTVRGSLPLPPGPCIDLVEDDNFELNNDQYRIPKPSESTENPKPLASLFDKPDDPDSDAASDIADAVVACLIQSHKPESVPNVDKIVPKCSIHSSQQNHNSPRVKASKSKSNNKLVDNSIPNAELPSSPTQNIEDEDILGTDHILMEKDNKNRFRRTPLILDDFSPKKHGGGSSYGKQSRSTPRHIPRKSKPQHIQSKNKRPLEISSENLHPSWQAKREQRQKFVGLSKGPPPQAKHVIFDQ